VDLGLRHRVGAEMARRLALGRLQVVVALDYMSEPEFDVVDPHGWEVPGQD
jgi:hypothetical protein